MYKSINLTLKDIDIISLALIDNAVIGCLNKYEYNLAWDILERLFTATRLSISDLNLICDSLRRYAFKYEYEHLEVAECKRVLSLLGGAKHE